MSQSVTKLPMSERVHDPAPLASQGLVDATRAWLDAHTDAAPALRRLVSENLAGVERALAAQARDRM